MDTQPDKTTHHVGGLMQRKWIPSHLGYITAVKTKTQKAMVKMAI